MKKITNVKCRVFNLLAFFSALLVSKQPALAGYGGIGTKSANSLGETIVKLVKDVGMPLGGGILFLSVVFLAIKIMISGFKPRERESVMGSFGMVALGGILLGGALFVAGAVIGIGEQLE